MKKLESSLTNMVIVLVAVAVITGGLLAWVNHVTEAPIKKQDELTLANGIKSVMCTANLKVTANDSITRDIDGKPALFVIHKVAGQDGKFIGAAIESVVMAFGGELKVLVGFDAEGKILGYTVLQHAETPGLGAKADKWFQADGKGCIVGRKMESGKPLVVAKDGGDVDAITASTITTRAFLKAVNQAYDVYVAQDDSRKGTQESADGMSGASKQTPAGE